MKKTFPETLNVPLSPYLLPHSNEGKKKRLTSTPLPLNSKKKKKEKKSRCTLSPFAQ
jgi:hypothetical protein